jgi:integrase
LSRHITALKQWHISQGLADPSQHLSVKKTLSGIQRIHGQPKERATPLLPEDLIKIVAYLNQQTSLSACRDSALLQIGFFGAFRRSELANICYEDLNFQKQGVEIFVPHSKTDQERQGQYCAIPYGNDVLCPVSALENWLKRSAIMSGPLFRKINRWEQLSHAPLTPAAINTVLKKIALAANIKHALQLSGHSLRRGFTSAASHEGVALQAIMRQGRWQQVNTVMEYIEAAQRFSENAADIMLKKIKSKND